MDSKRVVIAILSVLVIVVIIYNWTTKSRIWRRVGDSETRGYKNAEQIRIQSMPATEIRRLAIFEW